MESEALTPATNSIDDSKGLDGEQRHLVVFLQRTGFVVACHEGKTRL
jgi:hypothetical protein